MTTSIPNRDMTENEIGMLLGRIAAFDARTVGQSEIIGWLEIAKRGRWTLAEATEQVINYFSTDQGERWLMPGRINTMIRMARQDAAMRQPTAVDGRVGGNTGAPEHVMRMWKEAREKAKRECRERRELLHRHPDLEAKLTQPPLSYERPDQWNGYVPPATIPDHTTNVDGYIENNSPRRAALLKILREAEQREAS